MSCTDVCAEQGCLLNKREKVNVSNRKPHDFPVNYTHPRAIIILNQHLNREQVICAAQSCCKLLTLLKRQGEGSTQVGAAKKGPKIWTEKHIDQRIMQNFWEDFPGLQELSQAVAAEDQETKLEDSPRTCQSDVSLPFSEAPAAVLLLKTELKGFCTSQVSYRKTQKPNFFFLSNQLNYVYKYGHG